MRILNWKLIVALGCLILAEKTWASNLVLLTALQTSPLDHTIAARAASCGLLRQRELERKKVIREYLVLYSKSMRGDQLALLESNSLLTNKLFMAPEDWIDEVTELRFTAELTEDVQAEIKRVGLENVFLILSGPGLIWHSKMGQLPNELQVSLMDDGRRLKIQYKTYANSLCLEAAEDPQATWVPFEQQNDYVNGF